MAHDDVAQRRLEAKPYRAAQALAGEGIFGVAHFGRTCPLPRTMYLKRRQLLDADRTTRVHASGGDADFGTHAELAAVGELG